jgi:hypothetical protein
MLEYVVVVVLVPHNMLMFHLFDYVLTERVFKESYWNVAMHYIALVFLLVFSCVRSTEILKLYVVDFSCFTFPLYGHFYILRFIS